MLEGLDIDSYCLGNMDSMSGNIVQSSVVRLGLSERFLLHLDPPHLVADSPDSRFLERGNLFHYLSIDPEWITQHVDVWFDESRERIRGIDMRF